MPADTLTDAEAEVLRSVPSGPPVYAIPGDVVRLVERGLIMVGHASGVLWLTFAGREALARYEKEARDG